MLDNGIPVRLPVPERPGQAAEHGRPSGTPVRPRRGNPSLVVTKPNGFRHYPAYLVMAASIMLLIVAIWLSARVHLSPAWHDVALFAHLASLVLGLGAVLVADYFFALWALRRTTFAEAVRSTSRLHLLVWAGLTGLVGSGALLEPDLGSPATLVKLGLVVVLTVNGVHVARLGRQLAFVEEPVPARLLLRGGLATAISQLCWWGAVVIGFLNANR
ncbi:hypothetical protein [Amycolatopsis sp. lyj-346]|uniref:hypothetical protein n=1 Tax=Amycolatopsis sp. lyj-346 TaxID=2789289 RepID=UPI00397AE5E0